MKAYQATACTNTGAGTAESGVWFEVKVNMIVSTQS